MKKITLKNIKEFSDSMNYSFSKPFLKIIKEEMKGYNGNTEERLKGFLADMQQSGCQGGMIGKYVYDKDCKKFYTAHIDELEEYIDELETRLGDLVKKPKNYPRYTFAVWLAFEEFCNNIYYNIFENEEE
jgi:hypothetical protein